VLLNGNDEFFNIHDRQRHLTGQMINACIVLHIYERLKEGAGLEELKRTYFPAGLTKEETRILRRESTDQEAKLKLLVEMGKERQDDPASRRILNWESLVEEKQWQPQWRQYKQATAIYEALPASSRDGRDPKVVRPEDPRTQWVNGYIGSTVIMLDSGAKSLPSAEAKLKKYKGKDINELGDLNRIAILPVEAEYADDFVKILKLLFPPKKITQESGQKITIPQTFAEPYSLTKYGYFKRNVIVAVDHGPAGIIKGNGATMAEIQLLPASMLQANILSGVTKTLKKDLNEPMDYTATASDSTPQQIAARQEQLWEKYDLYRRKFGKLAKKYGIEDGKYKFPDFPAPGDARLDALKTYTNLADGLEELATRIHVDAIAKDNKGWRELYLRTAEIQAQCNGNDLVHKRVQAGQEADLERLDILDPALLKEIAGNDIDLRRIKTEVTKEHGREQARSHVQKRS
jgi:hypothetical protein